MVRSPGGGRKNTRAMTRYTRAATRMAPAFAMKLRAKTLDRSAFSIMVSRSAGDATSSASLDIIC